MNISPHTQSILSVERAIADLRRGFAVIIENDNEQLLMAVAENATDDLLHLMPHTDLTLTSNRLHHISGQSFDQPHCIATSDKSQIDQLSGQASPAPSLDVDQLKLATELQNHALALTKLTQHLPATLTCALQKDASYEGYLHVHVNDIIHYKDNVALTLTEACRTPIVLRQAHDAQVICFRPNIGGHEHYAIVIGKPQSPPLVRVHSSCYTGDLLDSLVCDCNDQLSAAITMMGENDGGIILYMMQEGRDIGMMNKMRAYKLKSDGYDTVDANEILGFDDDERQFLPAVQLLKELNIDAVRLLTNNPRKPQSLEEHGIKVVERVPHVMQAHEHNEAYLHTKANRLGHEIVFKKSK